MKTLLAGLPHRAIELNAIADRIEEFGSCEPTVRLFQDAMSLEDISYLVEDVIHADLVIVAEFGNGDPSFRVKSPIVLLSQNHIPVVCTYSAQIILEEKNMEFDNMTSMVISIAAHHKRTMMIIPARGDESTDPAYMPPKCWLDNLVLYGNTLFYS